MTRTTYSQAPQYFIELSSDSFRVIILGKFVQLRPKRVFLKDVTDGPLPHGHVAFSVTKRQIGLDAKERIQGLEKQHLVPAKTVEPDPLAACFFNVADAPGEEALNVW